MSSKENVLPIGVGELAELAIVPLPNAVFFPNTTLPLHIFEPRYRELVTAAIDQNVLVGVVLLELSEFRLNDVRTANPCTYNVAGVGRITEHETDLDGSINIVLTGLGRVEILEELDTHRPYRTVRARLLSDQVRKPSQVQELAESVRQCVYALRRQHPQVGNTLIRMISRTHSAGALADVMASVLFPELEARQVLLSELKVSARLVKVRDRLAEVLARTFGEDSTK